MTTGTKTREPQPDQPPSSEEPRPSLFARLRTQRAFWIVVVAVPYLVFWILLYALYLRDIAPTSVRLEAALERTTNLDRIPQLRLAGGGTWEVRSADVKELFVARSADGVVALPVGPQACGDIEPAVPCSEGIVELGSPMSLTWARKAQPFDASQSDLERVTMTLRAEDGSLGLGIGSVATGGLKACLGSRTTDSLVMSADSNAASWPVDVETARSCPQGGLRLGVRDTKPFPLTDSLIVGSIATADLVAFGRSLLLTGNKSGRVYVDGQPHEFAKAPVAFAGAEPIEADLVLDQGQKQASVVAPNFTASSARVGGEELLPTHLEQNKWWVVSAFFGTAGLIGALLKLGDWLKERSEDK